MSVFIALGSMVLTVMLICVFVFVLISWLNDPQRIEQDKLLHNNYYYTMKALNDSGVTCNTISQYRIDSIQSTHALTNPLYYENALNLDRDLWNSKSCGPHWGWFEK